MSDGQQRRALCIGVAKFGPPKGAEEGPTTGWSPLPFAHARTRELAKTLTALGYRCTLIDGSVQAETLGRTVQEAIRESGDTGVLIVHILSHGHVTPSGALQVIGADGVGHPLTEVERWLRDVVDYRDRAPVTLFLLDICHAGTAARHGWQIDRVGSTDRAWVIAACEPDSSAYGGYFTSATANVLSDLLQGALDIDSSYRHAPLATVAQHIRREVTQLSNAEHALPQEVIASLVDISRDPPDLAFFPNPRFVENPRRKVRAKIDPGITPFLDDLDEALDPAHFVWRASGQAAGAEEMIGFFSGRSRELKILSPWVNLQDEVGLRVVTGSPGVGKSALIGVLVCAAHPLLREPTQVIWDHVEQAPYRSRHIAAVHARERGLEQVVRSIARQLGLAGIADATPSAEGLVAMVARMPEPPVIVVDALDEAINGTAIMTQLLLPISRIARADGEPVRLLVGMRPWREFEELRRAAEEGKGLLDLDSVPVVRLRRDVQQYVSRLLLHDPRWDNLDAEGAAHTLARAIAEALTSGESDQQWGAFLVAGLFTHHVLKAYPNALHSPDEARSLGNSIPRTLPEVLDLDLRVRGSNPWLRPVLAALAHARGDGMPAQLIRHVATVFSEGKPIADVQVILQALDAARFYLRHSAEVDGTARYRLFHQGMADHLRRPEDASGVFDMLLTSVPSTPVVADQGAAAVHRHWHLAEPYVMRHIAEHAIDSHRVDDLLCDAVFLLEAEPATVVGLAGSASGVSARLAAAAYVNATRIGVPDDRQDRRQMLALAAARTGASRLASDLAVLPGRPPLTWRFLWVHEAGPGEAPVTVIAAFTSGSRRLLAKGYGDGGIEVVRAGNGQRVARMASADGKAITAIAGGTIWGRPVIASATYDSTVRVRSLETGDTIGSPIVVHATIRALSFADLGGRAAILIVPDSGWSTLWDVQTSTRLAVLEQGVAGSASVRVGGHLVELHDFGEGGDHPCVVVDGDQIPLTSRTVRLVTAVGAVDGGPFVIAGDPGGVLGAWLPLSRRYVDAVTCRTRSCSCRRPTAAAGCSR